MVKNDFELLCRLNDYHVSLISKRVIKELQKINDSPLSGEDTGLENTWEEICAQVQVEESIYWEMYLELLDNCITSELEKEDDAVKSLISYMGSLEEGVSEEEEGDEYLFVESYAIGVIHSDILNIAANFENENISRYINGDF